jgi:5-methylcytosine-specific restriction enzyme A
MASWPYNTSNWKRLRAAHLSCFPWCEGCDEIGRLTPANTVDHRVAISDGGAPFPSHDGLASYCPSCHSAKTVRGSEAGAFRTNKPRKGCNPDGTPLDKRHPWHAGKPSDQRKKSLRAEDIKTVVPRNIELVGLEDSVSDLWD